MDPAAKKRKSDENGAASPSAILTPEDAARILEPFTQEQLLEIVKSAMCRGDPTVLDGVRTIADRDPVQRKLFIRGLGWDTTSDSLRAVFSPFGDLEEAVIICDKATGRSKGYGFMTYRHIDGALLALKDPSKKIDGRITVTQLAAAGNAGASAPGIPAPAADAAQRKIFVGNVPADMSSDRLLAHFASYGEIEEGPLGIDKQTGKFKGYALFVYKNVEAARAALVDPLKTIDGQHLLCKLANADSKMRKPGVPGTAGAPVGAPQGHPGFPSNAEIVAGNGLGLGTQPSLPSQYGVPGSGQSFAGYPGSGLPGAVGLSHHHSLNQPLQSFGVGTPGLSSAGSQVPTSLGGSGSGSYGGGLVPSSLGGAGSGSYGGGLMPSSLGGAGSGSYGGGLGGSYGPSSQYGGPGSGGYGGLGIGSSLYRMPPGSAGMPSGGYPETAQYSLSSSAYQSQQQQAAGSPGRKYPIGGGMYPSLPPYY